MWDLIVSVHDHCLSFYLSKFQSLFVSLENPVDAAHGWCSRRSCFNQILALAYGLSGIGW